MSYYHVMIGTKHIDLVKAKSEQEAVNQVMCKFGSSSNFVHNGVYTAVRT